MRCILSCTNDIPTDMHIFLTATFVLFVILNETNLINY